MLKIHDLKRIQDLDRNAMRAVGGGYRKLSLSSSDKRNALKVYQSWQLQRIINIS